MNKEEIFKQLKPLIVDILGREEQEVTIEKTLEALRSDSLDTAELIMKVEKDFDLAIPDEHMEKFTTIQSIVDYIFDHKPAEVKS